MQWVLNVSGQYQHSSTERSITTHHPEFDKVLKDGGSNEDAVEHGVGEEQQEEFVVGEAHAVVDPWK